MECALSLLPGCHGQSLGLAHRQKERKRHRRRQATTSYPHNGTGSVRIELNHEKNFYIVAKNKMSQLKPKVPVN